MLARNSYRADRRSDYGDAVRHIPITQFLVLLPLEADPRNIGALNRMRVLEHLRSSVLAYKDGHITNI